MFTKIENEIIRVLRDHLKDVPKDNITSEKTELGESLPVISLTNVDFEVKEVGFGGSIGGKDRELQDTFSGDGETREFTLKVKPLRPIITVEQPPGNKLKEDDYEVDYKKGTIIFYSPPIKAEDNILIRYLKPTETKSIRFNLRYHLKIRAEDKTQRDSITVKAMEILLREEDSFNRKGIYLKPVKGYDTPPNENIHEDVYGKTIEYLVESTLQVEIPRPRIEKIELQRT